MVFDATCTGKPGLLGLSHAWFAGGRIYESLSRLDAHRGVHSWREALRWLLQFETIDEVQFWGHGKWGEAKIDGEALDRHALGEAHPLHSQLRELQTRFSDDALMWFRTCETLGAQPGHDFARAWTDFFGGRIAGHTYVIGAWQSGLRGLRAGSTPTWSVHEGLVEGTPDAPRKAAISWPWRERTISCMQGSVPQDWFD